MNETQEEKWEGWAILELMGHRRLAGYVTQVEMFSKIMCRIDIPSGDDMVTQFYGGDSVYCLTPTTEEIAKGLAAKLQPTPVRRYELPPHDSSYEESEDIRY